MKITYGLLVLVLSLALAGCDSKPGTGSSSAGSSAAIGPTKITLKNRSALDTKAPYKTVELEVKKAAIVNGKTKVGGVDVVTHNLILANYDFDPKSEIGPKVNGSIKVKVILYAASSATETSPPATGTYEAIADRKQPAMKIGDVYVSSWIVDGNRVDDNLWTVVSMGMRQGSIKINSVKGDLVQGEFADYGAPELSNLKGPFNATIAK